MKKEYYYLITIYIIFQLYPNEIKMIIENMINLEKICKLKTMYKPLLLLCD